MKKIYAISWDYLGDKKMFGTIEVEYAEHEQGDLSLDEWGERVLKDYMKQVKDGEIESGDSALSYYVAFGMIDINRVRKLSVFRVIRDRNELENDVDAKTKEKIQKLLNLAMSDNKNEADAASMAAYRLMKKNSLTRGEVEGQEFITLKIKPQGKRVTEWERELYGYVTQASGVYFTFHAGYKGKYKGGITIEPVLSLTGRERDVLNAAYLIECYSREIEKMMKTKKKQDGLSTKQANDYRLGLIIGIAIKIKKDEEKFFAGEKEKFNDIVPVDTRIGEASNLFKAVTARKMRREFSSSYADGAKDAKKIVIRKAAEDKSQKRKRLGV